MGGGAMRAAAKAAGFTAGIRGVTAENYPVSTAARRAASLRPAAAMTEDVKLVASNTHAGVQSQYSEIDDWVFAGGEEEVMASSGEPMPRVVFGGVPSLQEAKEATSELSAVLGEAYLSSPSSAGYEGSSVADNETSLVLSNSQPTETKACVTSDISVAPAVPAPAIMAFRFLHESSMAQNVVASIASDPNVWNAVLRNQELQGFLQSQRTRSPCLEADALVQSSAKIVEVSSECSEPEPEGGLMDILQKIKITVIDMMSSLSGYFESLFGGKGGRLFVNSDGTGRLSGDAIMEASFMGLAVMAILVILLKRA